MLTKEAAETLGCKVAATTRVPRGRREKLARAVITLVKKAGLKKTGGAGWGSALSDALPLLQKLLPWLGGGAGGIGAYMLGKHLQPGAGATYGGGRPGVAPGAPAAGGPAAGGKRPQLFPSPHSRAMFGRMNINPTEMAARAEAMRDVGAGGAWRRQAHEERQRLIRGMYTQ